MSRVIYRVNGIEFHPWQCDCRECLDIWAAWMEYRRGLDNLCLAEIELREAKPATEAEWQAFLNTEFPREVQP